MQKKCYRLSPSFVRSFLYFSFPFFVFVCLVIWTVNVLTNVPFFNNNLVKNTSRFDCQIGNKAGAKLSASHRSVTRNPKITSKQGGTNTRQIFNAQFLVISIVDYIHDSITIFFLLVNAIRRENDSRRHFEVSLNLFLFLHNVYIHYR